MAVPWLQIVSLMPSILDVSRELLMRTRRLPPTEPKPPVNGDERLGQLEARIRALEENERRQAELVKSMADQLAQLAAAATALRNLTRWLMAAQAATAAVSIAALVIALR